MGTANTTLRREFAFLALAGTIWGLQPLLVKFLVHDIPPSCLSAARFFLVALTVFGIMRSRRMRMFPPLACVLPLLCMGICGISVNNIAQFSGLLYSTVGNATLIASTTPVLTALLAALLLRERLLPLQWLGIFVALGGVLFLVTRGALGIILSLSFNYGDVLFFISQLAWAAYTLIGYRVMKKMEPLAVTGWSGLFGASTTLAYALWAGEVHVVSISAPKVLCFAYIVWLVGVAAGVIFLGEPFFWQECLGALAIFSGVGLMALTRTRMHHKVLPNKGRLRH